MKLPQVDSVNEGDMVSGMPVKTVAVEIKGNRVNETIDRSHNLIMLNFILYFIMLVLSMDYRNGIPHFTIQYTIAILLKHMCFATD